jgi:hypothetical protein
VIPGQPARVAIRVSLLEPAGRANHDGGLGCRDGLLGGQSRVGVGDEVLDPLRKREGRRRGWGTDSHGRDSRGQGEQRKGESDHGGGL